MNTRALVSVCLTLTAITPVIAAATLHVTIIDRQSSTSTYTYHVPARTTTTSTGNANCNAVGFSASCSGNGRTTAVSSPGYVGSYQVNGATLSLRLPDGRIAVVNCSHKVGLTAMRSCRVPPVDDVEADFHGDKAKLRWSVSIDGRKKQDESYNIVAVLAAEPQTRPTTVPSEIDQRTVLWREWRHDFDGDSGTSKRPTQQH
jgi:hypothetical protein